MSAATEEPSSTEACRHCGSPVPSRGDGYCCRGCRTVADVLAREGLAGRFYALGGGRGAPAAGADSARDHLWLEPLAASLRASRGPTTVTLDAQGIHCSACVWVLDELFSRRDGAHAIVVNPTLGRLVLDVAPTFDLAGYVRDVEGLGYVLGPADKASTRAETALVVRTGIATAIAMNVMSFALAGYFGLSEEPLRTTLQTLSIVLAVASVAVGAPPFVRAALAGLRAGVLTLDVPIALGIALVGLATVRGFLSTGEAAYADTLAVFVALMLAGRLLEERSLTRARQRLLAAGAVPRLWVRRVTGEGIDVVTATEVREGDRVVIAPGEVLPIDAVLTSERGTIALDWVNGESEPVDRARGAALPAGALNAGETPLHAVAARAYDLSAVRRLLERPVTRAAGLPDLEGRVARVWSGAVLCVAGSTLAVWGMAFGDWEAGLRATTAVLVVTCPCGLGIATPLARELARARLRGEGLIVRTAGTFARAARVTRVVFDKTGTLTTGLAELVDPRPLLALSRDEQGIVAAIVAQSAHPRSGAVRRALAHRPADPAVLVTEKSGMGLAAVVDGHVWRVGSPRWAGGGTGDVVIAKSGRVLADLTTRERLRDGASGEIAALRARGLDVYVLSGDSQARAVALAARAGIEADHVVGDASPQAKARWLLEHDAARTLFVGDGINDLPAASVAAVSGTPAIDRPFLPARTDFHFTTAGLGPIRMLLETAALVRRVSVRNTVFALAYNVVAVSLAAGGAMSPWLAAVLMPLSSLVAIGSTVWSLAGGSMPRAHVERLAIEPLLPARGAT